MTTQTNLSLIWAATGGVTDPGDVKYSTGWIAEIPTFQNFNFVLQNHSKNQLALAEKGQFDWEGVITYVPGAQVIKNSTLYTCITSHTNQDPETDNTHSYWVFGYAWGTNSAALTYKEGMYIHEVNTKGNTTWDGNDITIQNNNSVIAYNTTDANDNLVMGNIAGKMRIKNVATQAVPDGRNLSDGHELFHEGHPPIQSEVAGTIPANPIDGILYGRKDANWVEVTATKVQEFPPQPVAGNGSGWYNLQDGELYIDVNDGDSSQWVPASNPKTFDIEPDINIARAGRKNVIINSSMSIWQRGTSFGPYSTTSTKYTADRWIMRTTGTGGTVSINRGTLLPSTDRAQYSLEWNQSVAATTTPYLATRIEDVRTFNGNDITLSLKHFLISGTTGVSVEVLQYFGTGGSSSVTTILGSLNPSGTLTKEEVSALIPTIHGKTVGEGSYLEVRMVFDTNQVFNYSITNIQLEQVDPKYPAATEFEYRPIAEELALCQRYYEEYSNEAVQFIGTGAAWSTTRWDVVVKTMVEKRVLPTVAMINPTSFAVVGITGGGVGITNIVSITPSTKSTRIIGDVAGGLSAQQGTMIYNIAGLGRLTFDAEL